MLGVLLTEKEGMELEFLIKREMDEIRTDERVKIHHPIVQRAIEKGGLITDSGRGSAVGYFTNTLCGFSKVDRFKSPIKLYP